MEFFAPLACWEAKGVASVKRGSSALRFFCNLLEQIEMSTPGIIAYVVHTRKICVRDVSKQAHDVMELSPRLRASSWHIHEACCMQDQEGSRSDGNSALASVHPLGTYIPSVCGESDSTCAPRTLQNRFTM